MYNVFVYKDAFRYLGTNKLFQFLYFILFLIWLFTEFPFALKLRYLSLILVCGLCRGFSKLFQSRHFTTSVCINIIATTIFNNSLILFYHKESLQLSIYSLSCCPKKRFSSHQNHYNLMLNIPLGTRVFKF